MALLDDRNAAYGNTDLLYKIEAALVSIALAIQTENPTTANHTARSTYALKVLANPDSYAHIMALGFTVDNSVNAASTDQQIKDRASAIWNSYAVQG